jgi:hypothetical protein
VTRLRVEIESLRIPLGHTVDRERLERALSAALDGAQGPTPGLTALERAVVARVAAAVDRAVAPGARGTVGPGGGAAGPGTQTAVRPGPGGAEASRPERGRRP